jgi:hypothetical protein
MCPQQLQNTVRHDMTKRTGDAGIISRCDCLRYKAAGSTGKNSLLAFAWWRSFKETKNQKISLTIRNNALLAFVAVRFDRFDVAGAEYLSLL